MPSWTVHQPSLTRFLTSDQAAGQRKGQFVQVGNSPRSTPAGTDFVDGETASSRASKNIADKINGGKLSSLRAYIV